ncbi:MAG: dihydroorotate dehydrogenase [Candidatus Peregrinibacteria bacterium]
MKNLSTSFCGVSFSNPLVLASGILGVTGDSFHNTVRAGAGGITTKSLWLNAHPGHKNPVMIGYPLHFLNAVGLSDAGIEKAEEELGQYIPERKAPLIANIVAGSKRDFGEIAERIAALNPDIIEVNISCPNVEDELGKPFACSLLDAAEVTKLVKARTKNIPITIKLSPNVENIAKIAKACEDAGADAITAINTVGPGMRINLEMRSPILSNRVGGVSGPGIFPIALKAVNDIYHAVKIPIIGTGGVMTGEDAIEIIMAGATLVGVGTMVYYRDVSGFAEMTNEMTAWMEKEGVKSLDEIRGCV